MVACQSTARLMRRGLPGERRLGSHMVWATFEDSVIQMVAVGGLHTVELVFRGDLMIPWSPEYCFS